MAKVLHGGIMFGSVGLGNGSAYGTINGNKKRRQYRIIANFALRRVK